MRHVITLRLDENERRQVRAEMRAAGIKTMSQFFRTRALESPGVAVETARHMTVEAAEAIREVRAIAAQAIRDAEQREARLVQIIAGALGGSEPMEPGGTAASTGTGKGEDAKKWDDFRNLVLNPHPARPGGKG